MFGVATGGNHFPENRGNRRVRQGGSTPAPRQRIVATAQSVVDAAFARRVEKRHAHRFFCFAHAQSAAHAILQKLQNLFIYRVNFFSFD